MQPPSQPPQPSPSPSSPTPEPPTPLSPLSPRPKLQPAAPEEFFGMPKQIWTIAGSLAALMIIAYLGYVAWDKSHDLKDAKTEADRMRADVAKNEIEANSLKQKLADTEAQIQALQQEKDAAVQNHKSLEDEMRAALESKDVTISKLQGKLTVNILDRIMFESGEAVLKPDGEAVLLKVGTILKAHPSLKVHVIGHTDNVPIKSSARSRFGSNWELSTARAIAAVRFLTEKGEVDPRQLGAVGYGEFRPVADNATAQGRARNRRIAITVISEELAGADAAPVSQGATNAPAASPSPAPGTNVDTPIAE